MVHFGRLKPCNPGIRIEIEAQQQSAPINGHPSQTRRGIIEAPTVDTPCVIDATEDDFEWVLHREENEAATTKQPQNKQEMEADERATLHQDAEVVGDMGQQNEFRQGKDKNQINMDAMLAIGCIRGHVLSKKEGVV